MVKVFNKRNALILATTIVNTGMEVKKTIRLNLFTPTKNKAKTLMEQMNHYHRAVNTTLKNLPMEEKDAYASVRKDFPELSSRQAQKAVRFAIGIYKSAKHNGRQPPKHVDRALIRYDKDSMTLSWTKRGHLVFAVATDVERLPLIVRPDGAYRRYLQHIKEGWTAKGILLERRGNCWFVYAGLAREVSVPPPKEGQTVLAVDVGSVNLITAVLFRDGKYQPLGHQGTENDILGTAREKNKRRDRVIKAAKWVVAKAKEHKAVIVLEYIKNMRSSKGEKNKTANRKINKIPYAQMYHWISHLAHMEGIPVRRVSARYSSQLCFRCGYLDKNNRHNGKFLCKQCGYTEDADTVGAYNVATMGAVKLGILTRRSGANLRVGYFKSVRALVTRPRKARGSCFETSILTLAETPTGFSRSQGL